jgi:phage tail sheath protein FI
MPVTLTFPGVYIQELPSGVHPITGVSTSTGAFVGWAAQGPTDTALLVQSFQDFQRAYGDLDPRSNLGYAVAHFFLNGGPQTYVVRVVQTNSNNNQTPATKGALSQPIENWLNITAQNEGKWAQNYWISVFPKANSTFQLKVQFQDPNNPTVPDPTDNTHTRMLPNLTDVETFNRLSFTKGDPRYVVDVLKQGSNYVRASVQANQTPQAIANPHDASKEVVIPAPANPSPLNLTGGKDGDLITPDSDDGNLVSAFNAALDPTLAAPSPWTNLASIDLFNILCVPGLTDVTAISNLQGLCAKKRAFMIVDCKPDDNASSTGLGAASQPTGITTLPNARYAAFFFPRILAPDPKRNNQIYEYPACGAIAGIFARTDADRGVWKAPAGTQAGITGIQGLQTVINDDQNGLLNPKGINCLRTFPVYGNVVWGARTLAGNDELGDDYKYIPVRRLTNFIEESLFRGTKWVLFEGNDEPLWAQIRLNVSAFMNTLFRQGAFQGASARDAYLVKCDSTTTTQNDINRGVVNIVVGFAPLKPAEFVVITIQQLAGQTAT